MLGEPANDRLLKQECREPERSGRYHTWDNNGNRIVHPQPSCLIMTTFLTLLPPVAAIGYSIIYLLLGGGFFGAVVIFIVAKIFRK